MTSIQSNQQGNTYRSEEIEICSGKVHKWSDTTNDFYKTTGMASGIVPGTIISVFPRLDNDDTTEKKIYKIVLGIFCCLALVLYIKFFFGSWMRKGSIYHTIKKEISPNLNTYLKPRALNEDKPLSECVNKAKVESRILDGFKDYRKQTYRRQIESQVKTAVDEMVKEMI